MIWLTWRQFRGSAALVLGALAAGGRRARGHRAPSSRTSSRVSGEDFFTSSAPTTPRRPSSCSAPALAYAVPAVVGVFWGAPMVARELEAGTHRLVWNQSITRTRWLATKLGFAGLGSRGRGLDRSR